MVDVVIVGGAIAGSTCAIELAQLGCSVALIEKDVQPRHKLCGEFLSGEVASKLNKLGVLDAVLDRGAVPINSSVITSLSGSTTKADIPGNALGLSRYALDTLLRTQAASQGVDLIEGSVSDVRREGDAYCVTHSGGKICARVVVGAYGRRSLLDRKMKRHFLNNTYPYVAFKTHVLGIDTADRVELFAFAGGYCGMSMVENNRANVCWVMHQHVLKTAGGSVEAVWDDVLTTNQALAEYLHGSTRQIDFCSASQLFFEDKESVVDGTLLIGDAAGMIAPLAGDGMAMAIDSALIAASQIKGFLAGDQSRRQMEEEYSRKRKRSFRMRMFAARALHGAFVRPGISNLAVPIAAAVPGITSGLVA
ncbi:MAG: NAD(P)/FAD-dependent oxidoreductase, partial [Rhodothermales bacterium]|nr:NAD(P)/FAD-dependent oxidoreductase [Rhodothermales bacterium]